MGNHLFCMPPATSNYKKNLIKILHFETHDLSELEGPLPAAEVMMDFPAQFLCCVSSAVSTSGRRICAVPADEELRASELYILLPMHKLNTRFSTDDMTYLVMLASQASGKSSAANMVKGAISQSKVVPLPASMSSSHQSSNSKDFLAQLSIGSQSFKHSSTNLQEPPPLLKGLHNNMICRSKSWMPKLETITEAHDTL